LLRGTNTILLPPSFYTALIVKFSISRLEWALIVFAIALVWLAEAMNTAVEFLADEISGEWRTRLGIAKDVAAAGVLIAAFGSAVIGALVLGPAVVSKLVH
jgi:diacylglycerol kinase